MIKLFEEYSKNLFLQLKEFLNDIKHKDHYINIRNKIQISIENDKMPNESITYFYCDVYISKNINYIKAGNWNSSLYTTSNLLEYVIEVLNPITEELLFSHNNTRVTIYLKKDYEEAKIWIDKFIELIFECWKEGFSERVFNLTINNGVDKKGNVIFIDFGELTFKKKNVKKAIKTKRWEKSKSFN